MKYVKKSAIFKVCLLNFSQLIIKTGKQKSACKSAFLLVWEEFDFGAILGIWTYGNLSGII